MVAAIVLQLIVWTVWCSRGRYALVVYSHSPIWQDYFEQHVLPAVGRRGVVLNWSERKQWPYSLPVALFRFFAGTREFNPLAIVFSRLLGRGDSASTARSRRSSTGVRTKSST